MFGKTKINETEVGVGPFLKTMLTSTLPHCNGYYYQASPIFGHNSFQEDPYCFFFKKNGPFPAFFLYFCLFNTVDNSLFSKTLTMAGFELRTSGVENDRSTNWYHYHCPRSILFLYRHRLTYSQPTSF